MQFPVTDKIANKVADLVAVAFVAGLALKSDISFAVMGVLVVPLTLYIWVTSILWTPRVPLSIRRRSSKFCKPGGE